MSYTVKVIFGKQQVDATYRGEALLEQEAELYSKVFEFATMNEKLAFIQGLNEAVGWLDICIPEFEFQVIS